MGALGDGLEGGGGQDGGGLLMKSQTTEDSAPNISKFERNNWDFERDSFTQTE